MAIRRRRTKRTTDEGSNESTQTTTDSAHGSNEQNVAADFNTAVAEPQARRTADEPDGNVALPSTGEDEAGTKPRPRRRRRRSKRTGTTATTESTGEASDSRNQAPAEAETPPPATDSEDGESADHDATPASRPARRRRRSRSRRGDDSSSSTTATDTSDAPETPDSTDVEKPAAAPRRRTASRKKVVPSREAASTRTAERSTAAGDAPKPQSRQRTRKAAAPSGDRAGRIMLINAASQDECRIAVLHDGVLEELFLERQSSESHVGNIYKGRVLNIEPSIQAAFIDFGLPRNGFLHITDVQPQYFPGHTGGSEDVGRKIPRHHRPPIHRKTGRPPACRGR